MSIIFRCHSKLLATHEGPMVNKNPLHLRQSDLDSACGPHCALMALMLLGVVDRDDIEDQDDLRLSQNKALAKMWKRSANFYFTGTAARDLQSVFEPYSNSINSRLLRKNGRIANCIENLEEGGTGIVGMHNDDWSHWSLIVGVRCQGELDTAESLLLLDPDAPIIPLSAWNATLSVKANSKGMHKYETAAMTTKVMIDSVLALTPRVDELDVDFDLDLEEDLEDYEL